MALLLVCGILGSLPACDDVSGPEPAPGPAPLLSSFSFDPAQVSFEQLPADHIVGDSLARIQINIEVRAEDAGGCAKRIGYVIASGLDTGGPQVTGSLRSRSAPAGQCANGWYAATANLELPRGAVGPYTIRVYAVGEDGQLGDQMQGMFKFVLEQGKPPVLESVEASADTVHPPADLRFVATVSDPDGLSNVEQVLVDAPNGSQWLLHDDGQRSGDETAADGRYTATFDVPADAEPGEGVFSFWATDRNGLSSDTLEKTIVVAE